MDLAVFQQHHSQSRRVDRPPVYPHEQQLLLRPCLERFENGSQAGFPEVSSPKLLPTPLNLLPDLPLFGHGSFLPLLADVCNSPRVS